MQRHLISAIALLLLASGCSDIPSSPGGDTPGSPNVGESAPDFTKTDTAGRAISLSQFRGKVVLIDFWATWCGPCISAFPDLQARWNRFKGRDFMVLGISLDSDPGAWRTFLRDNRVEWANVLDTRPDAVYSRYQVTAIPMTYLIGRDGKVIAAANYIENIDDLIEGALGQ